MARNPVQDQPVQQPATQEATPAAPHNAELHAALKRIDALEKLLTDSAKQSAGIVLDQQYEEWKKWAALSSEEKTQLAATKTWGHETAQRWSVCVPSNPEQPRVTFPANSVDEAEGRYRRLCGIKQSDFPVVAVPA